MGCPLWHIIEKHWPRIYMLPNNSKDSGSLSQPKHYSTESSQHTLGILYKAWKWGTVLMFIYMESAPKLLCWRFCSKTYSEDRPSSPSLNNPVTQHLLEMSDFYVPSGTSCHLWRLCRFKKTGSKAVKTSNREGLFSKGFKGTCCSKTQRQHLKAILMTEESKGLNSWGNRIAAASTSVAWAVMESTFLPTLKYQALSRGKETGFVINDIAVTISAITYNYLKQLKSDHSHPNPGKARMGIPRYQGEQ